MTPVRVNLYEGLFLLSPEAGSNLSTAIEFLQDVFKRAEAEVLVLRRWDDRKLAYAIHGQKRGTYVLAYFKARGTQIANIERDCNLSEQVTRCMIIKADHVGEPELELAKREVSAATEAKVREGGSGKAAETADVSSLVTAVGPQNDDADVEMDSDDDK